MTTKTTHINLKPLNVESAIIWIEGLTPLMTHRFGETQKAAIRRKNSGDKSKVRTPCNPEAEMQEACYILSDGSFGFPAVGIKCAIIDAAHKDLGIPRTHVERGFYIHADEAGLVRIQSPNPPRMREDVVRVGGKGRGTGAASLRYRPEWEKWGIELRIEFDADWLTLETIVNLTQRAGFGIGIGEMRPEKRGDFGRFQVANAEEK